MTCHHLKTLQTMNPKCPYCIIFILFLVHVKSHSYEVCDAYIYTIRESNLIMYIQIVNLISNITISK